MQFTVQLQLNINLRMKKVLKIVSLMVVAITVSFSSIHAQQMNRRTQFNSNPYFINPAYAGTKLYTPIFLSYRNQWTGFENAPVTYFFSTHFSLPNNFGGGINVIRDETGGAISNSQIELTGSYSVDLNATNAFSIGISTVVNQFVFDGTDLTLMDEQDPVLFGEKEQSLNFDGNLGVMIYGESYFLGLSVPQFLQTKHNVETANPLIKNQNVRHYNLMASYEFEMTNKLKLIPSTLIKYINATPPQLDLAVQLKMRDTFWLGIGYRHQDALTTRIGLHFNNIILSYAYDYTISNAYLLSPHTHEVTLGYHIQRKDSHFVKKSLNKKIIKRKRKVK